VESCREGRTGELGRNTGACRHAPRRRSIGSCPSRRRSPARAPSPCTSARGPTRPSARGGEATP
jgi:hypothetical protein